MNTSDLSAADDPSVTDPHAGQGGSYLLDPETGVRQRIEAPTAVPSPRVPEPLTHATPVPGRGKKKGAD